MNAKATLPDQAISFAEIIHDQGMQISGKLDLLRQETFIPDGEKTLRLFPMSEVADLLGVSQSYLKKLHLQGKGVEPTVSSTGRRFYTAEQMNELRELLGRSPRRQPGEKLQVIAVVNFKGGSGKTTSSAHLAQFLALKGYRVLAMDLDPQASLTTLFGIQPEIDNKLSIYEAIRYDDQRKPIREVIEHTNFPNLDIVPATLDLQEFEYETPLAMQRGDGKEGRTFYTRVGAALADVEEDYDVVVIDCPPQLGYLTLTALTTATAVLITVHPQMLDVMSMSQFLLMLGGILQGIEQAGVRISLDWFRYLITRYEPADVPQQQMVGFMQSMFAQHLLKNAMVKSTAIADAGLTKQTVYEVERSTFNTATYDRARQSLDAVNSEIITMLNQTWGRRG
ncbi:plasmid partitioning protein RepA [Aquamicrobium sp. NLF2-7]|uniref:plasmid partitioning protein RepA n=1 Tax=Aquamicrobium sp. NLF2-7 TaxID=2918753 RepID=UPI001EFA7CED|nr:plasmid partitioning protein RepA [Aquamicrobium sp. NLF2-7]MCG8274089.1 plasmid partitioning protein RepA [Aquamicrobium sp. NLF2-7]